MKYLPYGSTTKIYKLREENNQPLDFWGGTERLFTTFLIMAAVDMNAQAKACAFTANCTIWRD